MSEPVVHLQGVEKSFGTAFALRRVSFEAARGKTTALFGPSGCGKSTLLSLVAGLDRPDAGRILLAGRDVTHLSAEERSLPLVFQNHLLFPHLNVFENVSFGLRMRRVGRAEIKKRVLDALVAVGLEGFGARTPAQLSGGQAQRVALARALVLRPAAVLLDEPFSNLDETLKSEMRALLRGLQEELGLTTLLVTHDVADVLTLAQDVLVLDKGRVLQQGNAKEVFLRPCHAQVAKLYARANVVFGQRRDAGYYVDGVRVSLPAAFLGPSDSDRSSLALARDAFELSGPFSYEGGQGASRQPEAEGAWTFAARVVRSAFLGAHCEIEFECELGRLTAAVPRAALEAHEFFNGTLLHFRVSKDAFVWMGSGDDFL